MKEAENVSESEQEYLCPMTGAYFKFLDLSNKLDQIRIDRGDPDCD